MLPPDGLSSSHHLPKQLFSVGLLLACWLLHLSWAALHWGPPDQQRFLAGLLYVPVFLLAALCCALRSRRSAGAERGAWATLGLATLAFGLAQTLYTYIQEVLRQAPFPSAADALFLLVPVFLAAALVLLPGARLSRRGWLRLVLEVGIMIMAVAVFSWHFLLAGLLQAYQGQPLAGAIALIYPVSDLVLLLLLLLLLARRQQQPGRVTVLIGLGLLAFIVADSGFAQQSAVGTYLPGNSIDLLWSTGGLLFGLAASQPSGERPRHRAAERAAPVLTAHWLAFGPYLAVAATYGLLIWTYARPEAGLTGLGVLWGTALVTLMVVVRQLVAFTENAQLNAQLQEAAWELERRVAVRTAELYAANTRLQQFSGQLETKVQERTAELQRSQVQLAHQAQHDALTGLPNRTLFEDRLGQAVAVAGRYDRTLAVLYIDLDGFKLVNDTLGHAAGDDLLRVVARRLQGVVRGGDTVARVGGDEFIVLLTELASGAEVAGTAQRMIVALGQAAWIADQWVQITASVGAATSVGSVLDAATLQRQADVAMYRAKQGGKNTLALFTSEMTEEAEFGLDLAARLRGAAGRKEFRLVYQPQFAAAGLALQSFEALLRWTVPDLGEVSPGMFIPVAEKSGLIREVGSWVLEEVCRQQADWQRQGLQLAPIAVNVSALQFAHSDFVDEVSRLLERHQLAGRWLELELTERVVVHDLRAVAGKMAALRRLGVRLSIDDFGAGRTALGDLLQLPVDTVKIDQSLTQRLGVVPGAERVLQAIVVLAHALNLTVVAEGVETPQQLQTVTALHCERVQGYLLGRPESAELARVRLHVSGHLSR